MGGRIGGGVEELIRFAMMKRNSPSQEPSRRDCHALATTGALYTLLAAAFGTRAVAGPQRGAKPMQRWVRQLDATCRALRTGTIAPQTWQDEITALHRSVAMRDLLEFINFERLIEGLSYPDDRGAIRRVQLPRAPGLPSRLGFGAKLFAYKKATATPPHGHNGMVSAHLVLRGQFRVRTYHRVSATADHLILRPSRDVYSGAGTTITMSDERDNVHWFEATSPHAYTLDIPISGLYREKSYAAPANKYGMLYVDPRGPRTKTGHIRAPIIPFERAIAEFGAAGKVR